MTQPGPWSASQCIGGCSGLVQSAVVPGEFAMYRYGSHGWERDRFSQVGKWLGKLASFMRYIKPQWKLFAELWGNPYFSESAVLEYISSDL